nr:hypothetical protein GCM10020185_36780 [Pseudomonas brassicacearum subsp. brassicacearum]
MRQNLELHAKLFDLPTTDSRQRIDELIQRFNLQALADQPSGSLPLGLRQRLSLAVAVLHRPEVLILDEPTSGVDPAARDDFWRLLIELSREQGVTIFLSTHFMNEAQRCDRISLMHAGKVLACDTPAALQAQFNGQTLEAAFVTCLEKAQGETQQDAAPVTLDSADAPRGPARPEPRSPVGRCQPGGQGAAARQGADGIRLAGRLVHDGGLRLRYFPRCGETGLRRV